MRKLKKIQWTTYSKPNTKMGVNFTFFSHFWQLKPFKISSFFILFFFAFWRNLTSKKKADLK